MIISSDYGPQIDPSDGTCGHTKLVKRYVLVSGPHGDMWTASQGRCTRATKKEAQAMLEDIRRSNHPSRYPEDLRVAPWWCWPDFDPAYPIRKDCE